MKCLIAFLLSVFLASAGGLGAYASGQQDYTPPVGPTPRTPSGKVDFSGVWEKPYVPDMSKDGKGQKGQPDLPFTPWGENEWKTYDAANGDYTGACLPFGMTRSMNTPEPMQFMQSDKYLSFLFEQNSWFTVVPIDGRPHRTGDPTWFGDSVGHWEGDTLVIETVNFNGKTRLDTIGHPHSDQLQLTQRFSRPDLGHITYEVIVNDPKTFTKSWKNVRTLTLRTDWEMMEYSCEENNKSLWEGRIKVPKYKP
ncbi:MAG TPA: hypothetical protein VFI56_15420 [Vicinamibacterales bacterium]|nr:hypothetical protein [Vicinamibacterales bacterium]